MKFYQRGIIAAILLLWGFLPVTAQIRKARIGVNGLTCSLCVRSVEKSIMELDFIDSVRMNLAETEGVIYFTPRQKVSLNSLATKVVDAGFSVRSLEVEMDFSLARPVGSQCFQLDNDLYVFAEEKKSPVKGLTKVRIIGENFLPKKEYKKWTALHPTTCPVDDLKVEETYFIIL
ncbi:MAG: heavy metal-associated domain-containing protein [Bacteroidia bacterium]|nr:heavy metal-associated domain-containing protein [Bacteroidia bacterium]